MTVKTKSDNRSEFPEVDNPRSAGAVARDNNRIYVMTMMKRSSIRRRRQRKPVPGIGSMHP